MSEEKLTINIPVFLHGIWKHKWRAVIIILVMALLSGIVGYLKQDIYYVSESKIYIPPFDETGKTSARLLEYNTRVLNDMAEIGVSEEILKKTAEKLELELEDIKSSVNVYHPIGTTVLKIEGRSRNNEMSQKISSVEASCILNYIQKNLKIEDACMIQKGGLPWEDGRVSVVKYGLSGIGLGVLINCLMVVLSYRKSSSKIVSVEVVE